MRQLQHEFWIPSLVVCLVGLLLLSKPVHLDEANFLMLTEGSFWAPHLVKVNWQGHTQTAFDVLSNPAGIAWWLWPVRDQAEPWMRLWMLPWSILALWGAGAVGRHFWSKPSSTGSWLLGAAPVFWSSHLSLMPDMPLIALTFSGYALFFKGRRGFGATLVGLAFCFRYSALLPIVMMLLLPVFKREWWSPRILMVCFGPAMLFLWDFYAYGELHFFNMIGFQSIERTTLDRVHALAALLAMLSGGALSMMSFTSDWLKWGVSLLLGLVLILPLGFDYGTLWGWGWVALGMYFFLCQLRWTSWKSRWMCVGLVLSILFLWQLRFAATRYWGPMLLFPLLACLGSNDFKMWKCAFGFLLSLGVLHSDWRIAAFHKDSAQWVHKQAQQSSEAPQLLFAGHWGLQHYLEKYGWNPIEEDAAVPEGALYALSEMAWPQTSDSNCWSFLGEVSSEPFWGLVVHSSSVRSHFHSNVVSPGGVRTLAPFGFAADQKDRVSIWLSTEKGDCCEPHPFLCLNED